MADVRLVAKIYGGFSLRLPDGLDLTPKGLKERGILALILMQPEQRRSREHLQDMLWPDSPPEKGAANLRRALSNIRTALDSEAWRLKADRTYVRFDPPLDIADPPPVHAVLFEDIDIPATDFERWLSDIRVQDAAEHAALVPHLHGFREQKEKAPEVLIEAENREQSSEEAFLTDQIASGIAERLQTLGEVIVHVDNRAVDSESSADTLVSIRTLAVNESLLVHLRVQALPSLRFMAAFQLKLPRKIEALIDHADIRNLINKGVQAIVDHNAPKARSLPFFAIQNAVRRLYSGDRRMVSTAESILSDAQDRDSTGLALAWRGFARLTEALEFRDNSKATIEAAISMANEATHLSPQNPVVWALASQIHIQLASDLDLGTYCARRSLECLSDDPYALDAMSAAKGAVGDSEGAHQVAEMALRSASGMSNEFSWDMQCCLTALGLGKIDDAIRHAHAAHLKVPGYRPAVRYLAALNIIDGNAAEAQKYIARLKKLEPDFSIELLANADYPLYTLHRLGLGDSMNFDILH